VGVRKRVKAEEVKAGGRCAGGRWLGEAQRREGAKVGAKGRRVATELRQDL
jgi:hypothetical protein